MTEEEMLEEFRKLPYEMLVASVVQIKSEMIEAYKMLDTLTAVVTALLVATNPAQSDGVTQDKAPGQYL
jgi:hypothetical protein